MKKEELLALLRQYMGTAGDLGDKLVTEIIRQVNTGLPLSKAIDKALIETAFTAGYFNQLIETICTAAFLGYGIKAPTMEMKTAVREYLLSNSWASDKMTLSKRLHGTSKQMRTVIVDTIAAAMRKGKSVKQMSRELYDGYNSGKKVLRGSELPQYLQRMVAAARSAAGGDLTITREFNQAIKQAQKQLEKMNQPDKSLKAAYTQLVKAAEDLNVKAIEKAAWVAVQEKARYYADRIAVTESARAWSDGFYAKTYDDPLVIGYGWRLSTRHPRVDVCDFHAKVDHYGMGAGNYPKHKMPPHPAHPFCTCNLIVIYKGEADPGKFNPDAGAKWIKAQGEKERRELLGIEGNREFGKNGKWQKWLRNWQGHVEPGTRLNPEGFLEKYKKSSIIKLRGDYSPAYREKLLDAATTLKAHGFTPKEHSLNRIVGRIAQGRLPDMKSIILVAISGNTYRTTSGTIAKYDNGISVHFNEKGEIVTVTPRKRVPDTWELI
jgi:hypothetical protein